MSSEKCPKCDTPRNPSIKICLNCKYDFGDIDGNPAYTKTTRTKTTRKMRVADYDNIKPANPRCPNIECDFHKDPPPAKSGFAINVIEEGAMGKIFKSEAYGIVSCKNCGHIIGVGNKG